MEEQAPQADIAYPLSELARARLRRYSAFSFLGALTAGALIFVLQNWWLYAGFLWFLGLFAYRRYLLAHADPHVVLSGTAIDVRWMTQTRVPLDQVAAIGFGSDQIIVVQYRETGSDTLKRLNLLRWRLEDGGSDLVRRVRQRCGLDDAD